MGTTQRVRIEQGQVFDEHRNVLNLDDPEFSDIKEAMSNQPSWNDGTYRLDRASKTLISDGGGGLRQ